jgi:hypothetical protein
LHLPMEATKFKSHFIVENSSLKLAYFLPTTALDLSSKVTV